MNKKTALQIAGSLSKPSKMPGWGYGLPAKNCHIGSQLQKKTNTVCSNCYALKGRYIFDNVVKSQEKRLKAIEDPQWTEAMIFLIRSTFAGTTRGTSKTKRTSTRSTISPKPRRRSTSISPQKNIGSSKNSRAPNPAT